MQVMNSLLHDSGDWFKEKLAPAIKYVKTDNTLYNWDYNFIKPVEYVAEPIVAVVATNYLLYTAVASVGLAASAAYLCYNNEYCYDTIKSLFVTNDMQEELSLVDGLEMNYAF